MTTKTIKSVLHYCFIILKSNMTYLLFCILFTVFNIFLQLLLKVSITQEEKFWFFQFLVVLLTIATDSISSSIPFVFYSSIHVLPLRIDNIPLENILFGYNLIWTEIIVYEYMKKKRDKRRKGRMHI